METTEYTLTLAFLGATSPADGAWFHDLRRTAVRNLEQAGVSRSTAMQLTGHKTEAVYRRYAIVALPDLTVGVKKLARLHARPAQAERKVVLLTAQK